MKFLLPFNSHSPENGALRSKALRDGIETVEPVVKLHVIVHGIDIVLVGLAGRDSTSMRCGPVLKETEWSQISASAGYDTWSQLITLIILTWLKHIAKYTQRAMANFFVSLRLNTFTKIDLNKWLDEPFTPPPKKRFLHRVIILM